MFRGSSTVSMDSKGRIAIPAKHRGGLTNLVIAPNPLLYEPCLFLYALEDWEVVEKQIVAQPNTDEIRHLKRVFLGEAEEYVMDGQGRVLLTPDLRDFATLGKKVRLVGQGNRLEIWDAEIYRAMRGMQQSEDSKASYKQTVQSLSF